MAVEAPNKTPGQALSCTAEICVGPFHLWGVLSLTAAKMLSLPHFWTSGGREVKHNGWISSPLDVTSIPCSLPSPSLTQICRWNPSRA